MSVADKTETAVRRDVLAGATIGNMLGLSPAVHSVFGLFLVPLSEEFNLPRASISGGLALLAVVSVFIYPAIGRYVDRRGVWHIVLIGVLLFGLTIGAQAFMTGALWEVYALYFLLAIFGAFLSPALFTKIVADTYKRDFGPAVGFSAGVGTGIGCAVMPIVGAFVLTAYGWRAAFVALSVMILALGVPAVLYLLRSARALRPEAAPGESNTAESEARPAYWKERAFWIILFALAMMAGSLVAVFGHIVPILGERGIGLAAATIAVSVCSLMSPLWQPFMGWLIDRFNTPRLIAAPYLTALAGVLVLAFAQNDVAGVIGGALLGLGLATQFCSVPLLVARYFGLQSFGSMIGLMYAGIFFGQGMSPVLLDLAYDLQGTYHYALMTAAALVALCAIAVLFLPGVSRKEGEEQGVAVLAH